MIRSILTATVLLCACGSAAAGTKGALYDFNAMLNAPHPFAGTSPAANAALPSTVSLAPPSRALQYEPRVTGQRVPAPVTAPRPAAAGRRTAQAAAQRAPLATPPEIGPNGGLFDRFYISFGGGLDFGDDLDSRTAGGTLVSTELDEGYFLAMALGRSFGESWRAELELSFRQADYGDTVSGGNRSPGRGEQTMTGLLVNGYFDLNLGVPLVPFIGAGGGVVFIDGDDVVVGGTVASGRDATEFAYQGIVGLTYDIGARWHVTLDGRYLGTGDDDVSSLSAGLNFRIDL